MICMNFNDIIMVMLKFIQWHPFLYIKLKIEKYIKILLYYYYINNIKLLLNCYNSYYKSYIPIYYY